ncbi:hypothetical protein HAX54_009065, partial [Datura stramonium]|nr:hypothetical protein [Datura stramonium]
RKRHHNIPGISSSYLSYHRGGGASECSFSRTRRGAPLSHHHIPSHRISLYTLT